MLVSWSNLLLHDLVGVMVGWFLFEIWQKWRVVRRLEQLWFDQTPGARHQ